MKVNADAGIKGSNVTIELGFEVEGHEHGHGYLSLLPSPCFREKVYIHSSTSSFASKLLLTLLNIYTYVILHVHLLFWVHTLLN